VLIRFSRQKSNFLNQINLIIDFFDRIIVKFFCTLTSNTPNILYKFKGKLPQFADLMSHDLNSCYLNALNVYLMLPFAIFMSDAKEKATEFRSKYKVTLLKEFDRKNLI
jgi:hypothetical protein